MRFYYRQALIGATAFFTPRLYGSVGNAKSLYKYHRMSGYLLLVLMFVTVGGELVLHYWEILVVREHDVLTI